MKNSNDTIGNQTRDLPACGAGPQPTAPPRVPRKVRNLSNEYLNVQFIPYSKHTAPTLQRPIG